MIPKILEVVKAKGYEIFTEGDFNLNIIAMRKKDGQPDFFDDWLCVVYKDRGLWQVERWAVTTDPGVYYLNHPSRRTGTAIVCPGQWKGYEIGLHKGKYKSLVQRGPIKVFRDANRDSVHDMDPDTIEEGYFGCNIHRSHPTGSSGRVSKWSAGCTVFSHYRDFKRFMSICEKQIEHHPRWEKFTYTLLEEE